MLDSPARVWERMGEVLLSTPEPCRPFIEALRSRCHSARYSGAGWVVPAREAEPAVALLRRYFPVVQDSRAGASPAPPFEDGQAGDPFARLDLVPLLTPLAPALRAIHHDRHEARAHFATLAAQAPDIPAALGFIEGLEGRWVGAYAAQRCWSAWLEAASSLVSSQLLPDGSLREVVTPAIVLETWRSVRTQSCGTPPERLGQRWYPPQSVMPIWVAALLACLDGPPFGLDLDTSTLVRTLPSWPMRLAGPLHRLDLKDAAHWPISVCVLPERQSGTGGDLLLHLSAVNGVSKNRALWAAILDGRCEQIPLRLTNERVYPRRVKGRNQYLSDWNEQPLASSGLSHLALTHRSAFEPELGQAFIHLAGNDLAGAPDLPLFAQQLSRALSVPFDLTWAEQLWAYGMEELDGETPLISPLPSLGCQGYWVRADEGRWTRLIVAVQRGLHPDTIADDDLVISEIGTAARVDEVIEQAGEGGEDESDE